MAWFIAKQGQPSSKQDLAFALLPLTDGAKIGRVSVCPSLPSNNVLTPQQTWHSIVAHVMALPAQRQALADAFGQVLAEPVVVDRDLPPADRSAMDGFAVRAADLAKPPVVLSVVGEVAAGSASEPPIAAGTCARIFTGANVPPGADTVVKVEDTLAHGTDQVTFTTAERMGANILRKGENARQGSVLVPAGVVLGAAHLAGCAAAGYAEVRVLRKPRVAVITTGRELLDPSAKPSPYQERDSNQILIAASLSAAGFSVARAERVSDERAAVVESLRAALASADAVVLSGGVSVGAYDFVPAAVGDVGARTLVHGVSIKPGKPFLFALAPGGRPIFGLPGNPLSAMVGLHEFVLPALRRMSGVDEAACRPLVRARLRETVQGKPGRQRHVLATLTWTAQGAEVSVVPSQSSADVVAATRADGYIVAPADARTLDAGMVVDFRPWRMWA
jgi:molybdenum cofactor synthesis domain-containing protein